MLGDILLHAAQALLRTLAISGCIALVDSVAAAGVVFGAGTPLFAYGCGTPPPRGMRLVSAKPGGVFHL